MTQPRDYPLSGGVDPVPYPAGAPLGSEGGLTPRHEEPSTADVAKGQAGEVASTAVDAGKHVANVAGEQAGQVASEATHQVKALVAQTRSELTEQAASQQQRVAGGLRSLSKELESMAHGSEQPGMATDLVGQVSERTNAVASWLEQREPGHVLDEVTRFARQRPGAFLALAAGAGLLVGRLGRGLKAATDADGGTGTGTGGEHAAPGVPANPSRTLTGNGPAGSQGHVPAPVLPAPAYPAPPTYDPSGYQPGAGGYQQPPTPSYPPQPPAYQTPGSGYPPPAPGYPPAAPGYPPQQGASGRDLTP